MSEIKNLIIKIEPLNLCKNVEKDKTMCIKEGKIFDNYVEQYDCIFNYDGSHFYYKSENSFQKIPSPAYSNMPFVFYINPKYYFNEILIGNTFIDLNLINNGSTIELIVYQREKKIFNRGLLANLNQIITISSEDDLFKDLEDDGISCDHCLIGYDSEVDCFYIIDQGRDKKGSTNGTYVRLKPNTIETNRNKEALRIIREYYQKNGDLVLVDYPIDFIIDWRTNKQPKDS